MAESDIIVATGKNISLDNRNEVEFRLNSAGKTVLTVTDEHGASRDIRVRSKRPEETNFVLGARTEDMPEGNVRGGYITFKIF